MRTRYLAVAALATVLLAACSGEPLDTDAPEPDAAEREGVLLDEDQEASERLRELGVVVADGVVRGVGIVVPLPEGWVVDPGPVEQGALLVTMGTADPDQFLLGVAGIEADPLSGFEGASLNEALDVVRDSVPAPAARDEPVALPGATEAHLLEYADLPGPEEGLPSSYQLILLAEDAAGRLALFNYVALGGSQDLTFVERLAREAGFDPGSEPPSPGGS